MKKKIILIAAIVAVCAVGLLFVKNRLGMSFGNPASQPGQIIILNDSPDKISVEYKVDGKDVSMPVAAREKMVCGSNGFVRVFTSKKDGSYELMYPADNSSREITLSQIVASVKNDSVEGEVFTKKGMIGDIKVNYEEVIQSDSTY